MCAVGSRTAECVLYNINSVPVLYAEEGASSHFAPTWVWWASVLSMRMQHVHTCCVRRKGASSHLAPTCSMNSSCPPGFNTRRSSDTARDGSGTEHRTCSACMDIRMCVYV